MTDDLANGTSRNPNFRTQFPHSEAFRGFILPTLFPNSKFLESPVSAPYKYVNFTNTCIMSSLDKFLKTLIFWKAKWLQKISSVVILVVVHKEGGLRFPVGL